MKDYKTLIADIRTEACELADKLKRLEVFMMSEDFCKISPEQKNLLETQYDQMAKLKVTLVKRAHRINYEHSVLTTKDEPALEKAPGESENAPEKDKLCQTCAYNVDCPNGERCEKCDNGSMWVGNCSICKHKSEARCALRRAETRIGESCWEAQ